MGPANGDSVGLNVLTQYCNTRFQESINNNAYFFNVPFSGVVASPAAWSFICTFMPNKSEEYPWVCSTVKFRSPSTAFQSLTVSSPEGEASDHRALRISGWLGR